MIDGLLAINDTIALNLLDYLNDLDISVPHQMKVIGFDNVPASKHSCPKLSSIEQNTEKIAELVAASLIRLIGNQSPIEDNTFLVPVALIERDSTCS